MKRAAAILIAIAACRPAVRAPAPPDPLWARAELVVGTGAGHLPLPARALVAIDRARALAILDDGGLAEIDLGRGETLRTAAGVAANDGRVVAAARVPGGRVLAVGAGRDRERAWWIDPARLDAHGVDVTGAAGGDAVFEASGVAVSGDGRAVAITGVRLALALRDPETLAITRVLSPERNWSQPAFVGDKLIAVHHGELVAWDLGTGRIEAHWPTQIGFTGADGVAIMHPADVIPLELINLYEPTTRVSLASEDPVDVAWSSDGEHVVVIDPDRAVVYDVPGGDAHPIAVPGAISRAVFSLDGKRLVISAGGALWRVDPATGRAIAPPGPSAGAIALVAPVGDGLVIASDRWRAIDRRGRVTASGGWRGTADGFALSPGGARVAATSVAGDEAFVEAWDVATGAAVRSALADQRPTAIAVGDDGAITAATPDGIERLAAPAPADALAVSTTIATARWAAPVALTGTGERAVFARAGAIAVADVAPLRPLAGATAFDCDGGGAVALSRDGARLAVVGGDRVAIHDVARGAIVATARMPGPVRAIALDGRGVVAATRDRVILWEPGAGAAATVIAMPAAVTAIGLDDGGDRVALGFGDGRAGIWRIEALRGLGTVVRLGGAGALPARCAGDPLAPGSSTDDDHERELDPGRGHLRALPRE